MSTSVRTHECYPKPLKFGDYEAPAPEPQHARCPGGHRTPGLIGGWHCPCPCHRRKPYDCAGCGESNDDCARGIAWGRGGCCEKCEHRP